MNRKQYKYHWPLIITLLLLSLLSACTGAVEEETPVPGTLGDAIEGRYTAYYRIDSIGHLSLKNGRYIFTPAEGITIPDGAKDRFYFIDRTKGLYSIEYLSPYDQNTVLENFEKDAMVTKIIFIQGNSWNDIFYIRTDIGNDELYFHSSYSEVQAWGVRKSWDE